MTKRQRFTGFCAISIVSSLGACGDAPARMRGARDAGSIATDAYTPLGTDAASPRIEVGPLPSDPMLDAIDRTRAASCPATSRWVVAVRGRVVDEAGTPLAGALAMPCLLLGGTDRRVCLRPTPSDADGVVTMIFPEESRCVDEVALRVLVPESSRAVGYCAVHEVGGHEAGEEGVLVPERPLVLLDTSAPQEKPPLGDEAATREVRFDGLTLHAIPRAIGAESYDALRARVASGALATDTCLGDGTPMDLLVAFAPEAPVDDASGLSASIEARGFSPGERVELFVLGGLATTLPSGELVPEATWHRFGSATVSPDGRVATPAGAGVPHLGWLGLRRAE